MDFSQLDLQLVDLVGSGGTLHQELGQKSSQASLMLKISRGRLDAGDLSKAPGGRLRGLRLSKKNQSPQVRAQQTSSK